MEPELETQDQTPSEKKTVTFEDTTEQEHNARVGKQEKGSATQESGDDELPSAQQKDLASIIAQLKNIEKANDKISAQVATKQKATQQSR